MQIAGIIIEYSPMHRGHAYLLEQVRARLGADTALIGVMSGNFVQRGDFAIVRKHARARAAVETFNRESTRSGHVRTEILERDGVCSALLELHDDAGKLMSMELTAPSRKQARKLAAAFHRSAEQIYSAVMEDLLSDEEA